MTLNNVKGFMAKSFKIDGIFLCEMYECKISDYYYCGIKRYTVVFGGVYWIKIG